MSQPGMRVARLTIEARTQLLFNWEGLYTWMVTGPAASPVSRHTPLPSTLAGMLASLAMLRLAGSSRVQRGSPDQVYALVSQLLGDEVYIRGPVLAASGGKGVRLYVEARDGLLLDIECLANPTLCYNRAAGFEAPHWSHTGVAVDHLRRSVVEHLLYTASYTMHRLLHEGRTLSIYAEAYHAGKCRDGEALVEIGGDRGVAKLSVKCVEAPRKPLECTEGLELLCIHVRARERIVAAYPDGVRKVLVYTLVLTPLPLHPDAAAKLLEGSPVEVTIPGATSVSIAIRAASRKEIEQLYKGVTLRAVDARGAEMELDDKRLAKLLQPRLVSRPIGYDRTLNKPRPYHLMIEPGSVISVEIRAYQPLTRQSLAQVLDELFIRGLSPVNLSPYVRHTLSALGWGTVLMLPPKPSESSE